MIPIFLSTTISVAANTRRGPPEETRLKNPFDGPMFIDEIRIRSVDETAQYPFGSLRVFLKIGQHIIVNRVHAWLLARRRNPNVSIGGSVATLANINDSGSTDEQKLISWKFKTPIWVERGQVLEIELDNTADTASNTIVANVAYIGRAATEADRPRKRKLPWATSFVGVRRADLTADTNETSKRTDLFNPANTPMRIIRLSGRVYTTASTTNKPEVLFRRATVRVVDQHERIIVRDETPFSHLLDHQDRVWSVNSILPPFGYYTLFLKEQFSPINASGVFLPYVGMVGEYTVPAFDRI